MSFFQIHQLAKHYAGKAVFDTLDLTIAEGKFLTLLKRETANPHC